MKLWYHAIVVIFMGLGGAKNWRGGGFKVIIHYTGKGGKTQSHKGKGGNLHGGS